MGIEWTYEWNANRITKCKQGHIWVYEIANGIQMKTSWGVWNGNIQIHIHIHIQIDMQAY